MKTNKILLTGILGIALAGVVLTGCHKASTSPDTDIIAAEDESNASDAMNDSKNVSDAGAQGTASGEYHPERNVKAIYSPHCIVSWSLPADTLSGYDTMYVTFPSTPTLCNDGRYRQGQVIVYWARNTGSSLLQSYFDSASTITMTFKNYAAGSSASNMIGITGTRAWTNTGKNALSEENWKFTANLTLKYFATSQTATWNSSRVNTLVLQGGVYYYQITGEATGTARNGVIYTLTITSPLYITAFPWWLGGCAWIEAGDISVNRSNSSNTLTINFGNVGTCDASAVATINGNNYTFSMW
jgi:hypothetical protein